MIRRSSQAVSSLLSSASLGGPTARLEAHPDMVTEVDVVCILGATGAHALVQSVTFTRADGRTTKFGTTNLLGSEQTPFVVLAPREYIVLVRGNVSQTLVGCQFVTNLGRASPFYGGMNAGERFEFASNPPGACIVGLITSGTSGNLRVEGVQTIPVPRLPKPSLTSLMLSSSFREVWLSAAKGDRTLLRKVFRGGSKAVSIQAMRAGMMSKIFASDEGLMRLLIQDETGGAAETLEGVPSSVFKALNEKGAFEHSLMDLMLAGREKDGRTPIARLFFLKNKQTGESVSQLVFKRPCKAQPSIAAMTFLPDHERGLRSLMQLFTDDEMLADASRPSLLRLCLLGEDAGEKSALRLLLERAPSRQTSLFEEMLSGEEGKFPRADGKLADSPVRRFLATPIVRSLLQDTPTGKPALGRYLFGTLLKLCV